MHCSAVIVCFAGLALVVTAKSIPTETATSRSTGCNLEGQHFDVGQTFEDACRFCWCVAVNTTMTCVTIQCDPPKCVRNMVHRTLPGDCCPSCVEV